MDADDATTNAVGPDPNVPGQGGSYHQQQTKPLTTRNAADANDSSLIDALLIGAAMIRETPVLRDLVELVPSLVALFKEVRENKTLLRRLAISCNSAIEALYRSYQRAEVKSDWATRHGFLLQDLQEALLSIQEFLKDANKKRMPERILTAWTDKRTIRKYEERLNGALKQFKVLSHLEINEGLDQALRDSHQLRALVMSRSNSNNSASTASSSLEYVDDDNDDGRPSSEAAAISASKDETNILPASEKPDHRSSEDSSSHLKPFMDWKARDSMNVAELKEELERLRRVVQLSRKGKQSKKKSEESSKHRKSLDEEDDDDMYKTADEDADPESRLDGKDDAEPGKKNKKTRKARRNFYSYPDLDAEQDSGPSVTWDHIRYDWSSDPTAANASTRSSDAPPPFPPIPTFGYQYPGVLPMPGYFPFARGPSAYPHSNTSSISFQNQGRNQYYAHPHLAQALAITNVGSGNVSQCSITNFGNDYSVRFGDEDSD